ncbi:MAG: recombination mediator RecR [Brevinematales bacterium]|nr:recombination mediator RecR [Brevinematales bacterium]
MEILPKSIEELVDILSEIPGIGPKTAERISFHILMSKDKLLDRLTYSLEKVKKEIKICSECGMISDTNPCKICSSPERDMKIICVVEKPNDVVAIEKTEHYNGIYHVLGGVISPIEGIGPSDISIDKLMERITRNKVEEVFFALDPDSEGETTISYITSLIQKRGINVKMTSLAKGIPLGGNIEYSDTLTLSRAIKNRNKIEP